MSEPIKPELDWPAIRAELRDEAAELALFVHLKGDTNGMALMYAGFDPNQARTQLLRWQHEYVMFGSDLSAQSLEATFPAAAALLPRIQNGAFQTTPAIRPARPVALPKETPMKTIPHTQSVTPLTSCQKTAGCLRHYRHPGFCTTKTAEERKAEALAYRKQWQQEQKELANRAKQERKQETRSGPAPAPSLPAEGYTLRTFPPPSPGCRFEIFFEEHTAEGVDRIAVAGHKRAEFERFVLLLARVIQEGQ